MPQTQDNAVLSRISSLIAELDGNEKAARHQLIPGQTKAAETELGLSGSAKKDPGGYTGGSTHPSAKVDSGLQNTPLGARAKENESDVKKDHPGPGVDSVSPGSGGSQDDKQLSIGLKPRATGEDHEHERDFKGTKEDPGTSHPADAEDVGEKYASMDFEPLCKLAYDRMNGIVADIANGRNLSSQAAPTNTNGQAKQASQNNNGQANPVKTAAQAGYDLAGAIGGDSDMEKLAFVHQLTSQIIADAQVDADLVGEYLYKFAAHREALQKRAEGDPTAMDAAGGMPPGMDPTGGGMSPGAGGMPPGMDPTGGMPPGGEMPPGGGEMPPGAGGMPADAAGGEAGGSPEDAINELSNALVELGATPEQVIQAMQAAAGGGGGGGEMPPGGAEGGDPAAVGGEKAGSARRIAPEDREAMLKMATAVQQHQRSGKMKLKEARDGSQARHDRDEIKSYIREVCGIR